jgi:hypothetical protein
MKSSLISRLISLSTIVANLLELDIVERTYIDAHVSGKTESGGDPILMDASMYDVGVKCLGDDGVWSIYCADRDAYHKVAFFTFAEKTTEPRRFTVLSDFNTQSVSCIAFDAMGKYCTDNPVQHNGHRWRAVCLGNCGWRVYALS